MNASSSPEITPAAKPSFLLARWLFLRGLALVFAVAFVSLYVQIDGLVGSRGILPIAVFLDYVARAAGGARFARLPTLCWLGASDGCLHVQCLAGIVLALALLLGFAPRATLFLLWVLYLSLVVAGQEFLSFQWDVLLLETAIFAIPFAPRGWRPGLARELPPSSASLWLLRWLLFRLMFASGAVKLTSGDPTWGFGDLSALTFHYWSQPLPTVGGWYAAQLPLWFQKFSCVVMYAIEIGFPWLIFGTRRTRQVACAGFVLLQILIALTGNYGFFNLLSGLLCLPLLDDAWLARIVPSRLAARALAPRDVPRARPLLRIAGTVLAASVAVFTGIQLLENVRFLEFVGLAEVPGPLATVDHVVSPFRSLNNYGLFRVMTKERREIEIQGSDDGVTWKPYLFRWKPGPVDRAPSWVQPHMPRLDWQMWFAALGPERRSRWFRPLLDRLLEGSPPVLDLFADNPFPEHPPREVRALLYDYRLTNTAEKGASGTWWTRKEVGVFASPIRALAEPGRGSRPPWTNAIMGRVLPRHVLFALLAGLSSLSGRPGDDARSAYDVKTYRLDLAVDPRTKTLSGTVAVEAEVTDVALAKFVLDLQPPLEVQSVVGLDAALTPSGPLAGAPLVFERKGSALSIFLPAGLAKGQAARVAIQYSGSPKETDSFEGFHWKKTPSGKPWICTSCQGSGSSAWWPCKDSYWHPEDKPERTFVNLTVPDGLFGVSNGRLAGREKTGEALETFRWVHEYPCETYAIAISVAPYIEVAQELEIAGKDGQPGQKFPFVFYAIPEDVEKAKLQFAEVPEMLEIYSEAFGPYPFPKSKFALVEANFWGMEHSTCIAYGSTFPAWCRANGEIDSRAGENARLDYILVHESAHEWWGNAVSAKGWGHFWIHEGFASYAEAVYLEEKEGAEAADAHLADMKSSIGTTSRLFRGEKVDSGAAYDREIYTKGAWVLHTLRHDVDDDDLWWKTLRDFNLAFRYENADTDDFRKILEETTQKSWKTFFDEWIYGEGFPILDGTVTAKARSLLVQVNVKGSGKTGFHVPIDLVWREAQEEKKQRVLLEPGPNQVELPTKSKPRDVGVVGLDRVLGEHSIRFQ